MANELDNVQIGDILVGTYCYRIETVNFYEVVGKTSASIKLQKLDKISTGDQMTTYSKPDFKKKVGKPFSRRPGTKGYVMEGEYSDYISLSNKYNPGQSYTECYMD